MPRIPVLTLSGGKLSQFGGLEAVKEFRVWVHHKRGGDDAFFTTKTIEGAKSLFKRLHGSGKYARVEEPLAVVWDRRYRRYREVVIDTKYIPT